MSGEAALELLASAYEVIFQTLAYGKHNITPIRSETYFATRCILSPGRNIDSHPNVSLPG